MGLASATHRRRHRDILEIIFFSSSPFVFNIQEKTKSLHSLHLTIHNTDLLTCVLSSTLSLLTLPRDILIHNVDGTTSLDYLVSAVSDVTSDCPRWRGRVMDDSRQRSAAAAAAVVGVVGLLAAEC